MSSFFTAHDTRLQGLRLPLQEELLDSQFVDDTAAYLHGHEANLVRFQIALKQFCDASGTKINWHKSCGFWVSGDDLPQWSASMQFQCIPSGQGYEIFGMSDWTRLDC